MRPLSALCLTLSGLGFQLVLARSSEPLVHPFDVNLSSRVPHMLDMIRRTELPSEDLNAAVESSNASISTGISLADLKNLRSQWLNDFDWDEEQRKLNKLNHFTTDIEGQTIHFIYQPSNKSNSIPLILMHGWPGSFLEMLPLIDELTLEGENGSNQPAFDVVIPSLPGFAFSSPTPQGWTVEDTGRIFDKLMREVLGYKTYAVHGTDWGAFVAWPMYNQHPESAKALHLALLPENSFLPDQLAEMNITLSGDAAYSEQLWVDTSSGGSGYAILQGHKPNTIGLALQDNPVGQLAWIAEKYISWSDPRRGTGPSVLTNHEILRTVSLYYLTQSFTSAAYIYEQNPKSFALPLQKSEQVTPVLFSNFKYNPFFIPEQIIRSLSNLVYYKFWDFGGHFPGLDNPPALVHDLRQIGTYWP